MTSEPIEQEPGTEPPAEPQLVTVDISDPAAVMTALGFPGARAVVLTEAGVMAISADYPPTPYDPEPPAPPTPEEAV
jgi:hypothetical protein